MPGMTTFLLGVLTLAAVVYAVGVEETKEAVTRVASTTKRIATTTTGAAVGGVGIGAQIGYELIQAGMMEPFAVTTLLAGIAGALGISGMLGDVTGLQFLLAGIGLTAIVWIIKVGDD